MMTKLYCPTCGVEIDEHQKGRCLDAWAAEVVMGWEHFNWRYRDSETKECTGWYAGEFTPSERIAASWMLVDPSQIDVICRVYNLDGEHVCWRAVGLSIAGDAPTIPHAITRAAIKISAAIKAVSQ